MIYMTKTREPEYDIDECSLSCGCVTGINGLGITVTTANSRICPRHEEELFAKSFDDYDDKELRKVIRVRA